MHVSDVKSLQRTPNQLQLLVEAVGGQLALAKYYLHACRLLLNTG